MKLSDIGGVAVDSKDNVYVSVRGKYTPCVVFDKNGNYIRDIGTMMGIQNPHGICVDPADDIWLVDSNRHVVHKFSKTGELLFTIGNLDQPSFDSGAINGDYKTVKRGGSPFYLPAKVASNKNCEVYVADGYGNCCIHHFTTSGELIKSWGAPGGDPGAFRIVHGVGVDRENSDVYVADRENRRVQIFDADGNLKSIWNDIHRPTDVYIKDDFVYVAEIGELLFTDNIVFNPKFYRAFSMVRIFDKKGSELYRIGTEDGGAPGSFMGAHGICADSRGDIYVCEVNNWERHTEFSGWPNGTGRPTSVHPSLQKFEKVI